MSDDALDDINKRVECMKLEEPRADEPLVEILQIDTVGTENGETITETVKVEQGDEEDKVKKFKEAIKEEIKNPGAAKKKKEDDNAIYAFYPGYNFGLIGNKGVRMALKHMRSHEYTEILKQKRKQFPWRAFYVSEPRLFGTEVFWPSRKRVLGDDIMQVYLASTLCVINSYIVCVRDILQKTPHAFERTSFRPSELLETAVTSCDIQVLAVASFYYKTIDLNIECKELIASIAQDTMHQWILLMELFVYKIRYLVQYLVCTFLKKKAKKEDTKPRPELARGEFLTVDAFASDLYGSFYDFNDAEPMRLFSKDIKIVPWEHLTKEEQKKSNDQMSSMLDSSSMVLGTFFYPHIDHLSHTVGSIPPTPTSVPYNAPDTHTKGAST